MKRRKYSAVCMAAVLAASAASPVTAMAGSTLRIDMTGNNDEAWANVAMVNDDTVETGVNIRASQSQDAAVTGYLYRGGAVRVLYKGEEWTEIQSGDINGYVKNEYLVYGPEAKGLAEHYGTYGVQASWNDVNVFASQSGAGVVDTAGDGDTYKLVNRDGGWMTVQAASGNVAYVPAEDVNVVMVLGGAVSVDGAKEDAAAETLESFKGIDAESLNVPSGASASGTDTAQENGDAAAASEEGAYSEAGGYTESYAGDHDSPSYDGSYDAGSYDSYTESYDDGSYDTGSYDDYSESYDDGSYDTGSYDGYSESYDDGSYSDGSYSESYSDSSYTDSSYSDSGSYDTGSYSTSADTSGTAAELADRAAALYQEYLTAQAAADAAVANGSGEQAIMDTAAAAVAAYGRYITVQNAADAASWGGSVDSSAVEQAVSQSYDSTSYDESYSDTQDSASSTDSGSGADYSSSDLELLAALIYCEAGNQPYEGQVAVGAVVMNRVASGSFPNTIREVIYQSGQFTPAYSGALASALASGAGSGYIGAASEALAGSDPTNGCLYFNNHRGSGLAIGAHWFY